MATKKPVKKTEKRQPPVKIPLSFDKAIEGLLAVKPKQKDEKKGK